MASISFSLSFLAEPIEPPAPTAHLCAISAQTHVGNPRRIQLILHLLQETRADDAAASIVNEQLLSAELPNQIGKLLLGIPSKDNLSRRIKLKIIQKNLLKNLLSYVT